MVIKFEEYRIISLRNHICVGNNFRDNDYAFYKNQIKCIRSKNLFGQQQFLVSITASAISYFHFFFLFSSFSHLNKIGIGGNFIKTYCVMMNITTKRTDFNRKKISIENKSQLQHKNCVGNFYRNRMSCYLNDAIILINSQNLFIRFESHDNSSAIAVFL